MKDEVGYSVKVSTVDIVGSSFVINELWNIVN